MSFVTVCPSCHTAFKIAQSQLNASDGWVRCGQCLEIFDASTRLEQQVAAQAQTDPSLDVNLDAVLSRSSTKTKRTRTNRLGAKSHRTAAAPSDTSQVPVVSFIEDARKKQFWSSAWVRATLALLCVCLVVTLLLQWVRQESRRVVQALPITAPAVSWLCQAWFCESKAVSNIEAVLVEQSNLQKLNARTHRLSITLRNASHARVVMPAVELTLTDALDATLVRRVILASESAQATGWLEPLADVRLEWDIKPETQQMGIVGYRVVVFYP